MLRSMTMLLVLLLVLGALGSFRPDEESRGAREGVPTAKDNYISVNVFMRDGSKNELMLGTRIWPDYPDYNTVALQRFFALMKALQPPYKRDDDVAYTWSAKGRVTKCSIYLEAFEAGAKSGTGAIVGCEANGVSGLAATSTADPKQGVSSSPGSQAPERRARAVQEEQSDRARNNLPKQ